MNTMPPIGTPCRHMTDRDNGLCCAIKGLKLADPEKCGTGRIVMPEGMDLVLSGGAPAVANSRAIEKRNHGETRRWPNT